MSRTRAKAPRKPARKAAKPAASKTPRDPVAPIVLRMGSALSLTYKHIDGKTYRHDFKPGKTAVTHTRDGRHIILTPAPITTRNGRPFIA